MRKETEKRSKRSNTCPARILRIALADLSEGDVVVTHISKSTDSSMERIPRGTLGPH